MTPEAIRQTAARLRDVGPALRRRSLEERTDAVGAVLDAWRDRDSPWRRRIAAELPEASGFSPEVVREGLERGLDGWSRDALRRLVRNELAALGPDSQIEGPRLTAVLLGGAIPMPSLLSMLLPLVVGSPVVAKPASRDPVTAGLVAESIAAIDGALGEAVAVAAIPSEDSDAMTALLDADCVVATGSDETMAALARQVLPPRRLIPYGHGLSIGVLGPECSAGPALEMAAAGLALDIALWDQQGCLSPIAIYAVGTPADAVASALFEALTDAERSWPRGEVSVAAATRIRAEVDGARLRAAAGGPVAVHSESEERFHVVLEADARVRPAPLHRFVRVVPVSERKQLAEALAPLSPYLAGVALDGFGPEPRDLARELTALGATRICAPGRLQTPPLAWHHDGGALLLPLARISDIEIPAANAALPVVDGS